MERWLFNENSGGFRIQSEASTVGWDTRARTRNNRTRICCVANYTISQFISSFVIEYPSLSNAMQS